MEWNSPREKDKNKRGATSPLKEGNRAVKFQKNNHGWVNPDNNQVISLQNNLKDFECSAMDYCILAIDFFKKVVKPKMLAFQSYFCIVTVKRSLIL